MNKTRFEITKDHLKLLKKFKVYDTDNLLSVSAPMIDQRQPYGSDNVAKDVLDIIGDEARSFNGEYPQQLRNQAMILHDEMSLVLDIVLKLGEIRTGEFKRVPDTDRWVEI